MKKNNNKLALILLIICFSLSSKAQMNTIWADTLNQLLDQCRVDEGMKGVAAGVVFSDGTTWSSASGFHGNATLSKDYLYDIGSNTKSMVSTIILQMEEEGKLALGDTLYSYISPVPKVSNGISIDQLLKHRSGVFSYTNHANFGNAINSDDTKFWHPDSILSNFLDSPDFAPGAGFNYSNTGYLLLGKVIESIDNKPLNQILKDRIFSPIGLDSTFLDQYDSYTMTKTGAWLSASNYFADDFVSFMSSAWAAGGVVSTPKDFAKYAHQLFSGQLFSAASLQKMQLGTSLNGGVTYGLGIMKWNYKGKTYLGHGGTTLQNSEMEYSVSSDFSLVVMNIDYGFYDETARTKLKFIDLLEYIEQQQASVGLEDLKTADLKLSLYPNPSKDIVNLEVESTNLTTGLSIEIYDLRGRKVLKKELMNGALVLRKEELGSGVFLVNVFENQQWRSQQKLVFN